MQLNPVQRGDSQVTKRTENRLSIGMLPLRIAKGSRGFRLSGLRGLLFAASKGGRSEKWPRGSGD